MADEALTPGSGGSAADQADSDLRDLLVDEEGVEGEGEEDESRRRRNVLVWLILLLLLLLLCCCCWRYGRWWKAPDQRDVAGEEQIKTATIPDVTGMKREDAIKILEAAGFTVEVETSYDVETDPDTVVSQDPPGGEAAVGSTVFITVTEPLVSGAGAAGRDEDELVEVPDVVGLPRNEAVQDIRDAGFKARVTGVYSDSVPEGFVISQTPGPGASAPQGSTVSILVSLGTEPVDTVPMPDVVGKSPSQAAAAIRAAGLEPRLLYQPNRRYVGRVYQQSPKAGTEVPEDRLVFVLIGMDYWWKAPQPDQSGRP